MVLAGVLIFESFCLEKAETAAAAAASAGQNKAAFFFQEFRESLVDM